MPTDHDAVTAEPDGADPEQENPTRDARPDHARPDIEERIDHARHDIEERIDHARHDIEERLDAARVQFEETNEKIKKRTGRDLLAAIGIGLLAGALLIVSLFIVKWLFVVFAGAVMGLAAFELATALRVAGRRVPRVPVVVVALGAAPAAFFLHVAGLWLVFIVGGALVILWRLVEQAIPAFRSSGRDLARDVATSVFVLAYIPLLAGMYLALAGQDGGEWWVLATLIIVVGVDTAAYATGLNFGRHKMAPTISPGKTWEGFAGAALFALIAGALLAWLMLHQPIWVGLILGAVLLITAVMGDLAESLIKRDIGVKDISGWLPGHGGFLDRLDSILPSGIVAFAAALIFDAQIPG